MYLYPINKGMSMFKISVAIVGALLVLSSPARAGDQQEKMKTCNADAATQQLKGDERKTFMKTCLSAKPAPVASQPHATQQEKMKACNADAATQQLKGDARKTFMKQCLSKKAA
jgi:hypothetical protein